MLRVLAIALVFLMSSKALAENWRCVRPPFSGTGLVEEAFLRIGDTLVNERWGTTYTVLEDNEDALIAVWSNSDPQDGPGIIGSLILIDKRSGEYTYGHHRVPSAGEERSITGHCRAV